jgi:hypothetical protein
MSDRKSDRKPADPPADATAGRTAQDHDLAYSDTGGKPLPGFYPDDDIENRKGENTPEVAHPTVNWDERVQPERPDEQDL